MTTLAAIAAQVRAHADCGFEVCAGATRMVPGEGPDDAPVVFVGEAPGASEDRLGRPFVGAAGRLLDDLLEHAGLERSAVYITNVVKARPPGNRDPRRNEVEHHLPWLLAELDVLQPLLVCPLGRHALAHFVAGVKISAVHGTVIERQGRRIFPLYHPAAALHNPALRTTLAEDAAALGETLRVLRRSTAGSARDLHAR